MNIHPLPALSDNYIWLIEQNKQVICVDPGQADVVLKHLHDNKQTLYAIWITHHHYDHTDGIGELQAAFPTCQVVGPSSISAINHAVKEGDTLAFGTSQTDVWAIPGHTAEHLAFLLTHNNQLHVFCGDTVFSAGCGRVFTGTIHQLQAAFMRFAKLPENTLFYPAHEYTAANLRFAAHIEPDNHDIQTALNHAQNLPTLPVRLSDEKKINPFFRFDQAHVAKRAAQLTGKSLSSEADVFATLRQLKNQFKS